MFIICTYRKRRVEDAVRPGLLGLEVVVLLRHEEGAREDEDEAGVAVRVLRHDHLPRTQGADLDPEEEDEEEGPNTGRGRILKVVSKVDKENIQAISTRTLVHYFSALAAPNAPLDGATSHHCSSQVPHF